MLAEPFSPFGIVRIVTHHALGITTSREAGIVGDVPSFGSPCSVHLLELAFDDVVPTHVSGSFHIAFRNAADSWRRFNSSRSKSRHWSRPVVRRCLWTLDL